VTWFDASSYCDEHGWRLPTEAEWEYAARGGSTSKWSFGDDERLLGQFAWFKENSGTRANLVGTRTPNAWGLYDMHGNVWEWVADWYGPYTLDSQRDPKGPASGTQRALRGGSFKYSAWYQRSADRFGYPPTFRSPGIGFRCARDASPKP